MRRRKGRRKGQALATKMRCRPRSRPWRRRCRSPNLWRNRRSRHQRELLLLLAGGWRKAAVIHQLRTGHRQSCARQGAQRFARLLRQGLRGDDRLQLQSGCCDCRPSRDAAHKDPPRSGADVQRHPQQRALRQRCRLHAAEGTRAAFNGRSSASPEEVAAPTAPAQSTMIKTLRRVSVRARRCQALTSGFTRGSRALRSTIGAGASMSSLWVASGKHELGQTRRVNRPADG